MQIYTNHHKIEHFARKILSDFLGFLKDKVDHDALTLEDEQALADFIVRNLHLSATCEDLARYYGKTPENVRAVIHRRLLSKPRRRVLYSFFDFCRIVPDSWVPKRDSDSASKSGR
jgi:hypothetical protein